MPSVVVTATAEQDLEHLIEEHRLPANTVERVRDRLRPLARFPWMGPRLGGRWKECRFLLGPWSWMIIVYVHHEDLDLVAVTTIQDARKVASPTSGP
jgi:plasmid stabilization system protein ParE